jgi:hypothetical protein
MAFRDALAIHGNDASGTHYDMNRRQQVPNSRVEEIALASPLADELLAEKAAVVPRFSLVVEKGGVWLTVGENRLRLDPK